MQAIDLNIPSDVVEELRLPPDEIEATLHRELAILLYARRLLPRAAARRLAGIGRLEFDELLGQRGVDMGLRPEDLDADLRVLEKLRAEGGPL